MKKFLKLSIISLGLFFVASFGISNAFDFDTKCQPPLKTFSDGNPTFEISFPPGGGTTCDTFADCPEIRLPDGATVFSIKVDMELTNPASEIGTPFIWIPNSDDDTLAQIRTSDGTLVELFAVGDNPSRITVMPGGDVWLANRGDDTVTRLSPKEGTIAGGTCGDGNCNVGENNGSCHQDCEEYEVNSNHPVGGGPRGATFDTKGKIWVGGYTDTNTYKFNNDGTLNAGPITIGDGAGYVMRSYGMIGDSSNYVWVSDRILDKITWIDINTNTVAGSLDIVSVAVPPVSPALYGIGIDNEGDIWVGESTSANPAVYQVAGANSGMIGTNITPASIPNAVTCGVAVDQNNVVWAARCGIPLGSVYAFNQDGTLLTGSPTTGFPTGNLTRGIAVDFDGNIWAVNRGGGAPGGNPVLDPSGCGGIGSVTKLASDGSYIATYKTCGTNPYCYSDMTGLRTVPKTITIGTSGTSVPLSGTGTFEICVDSGAPPLCSDSSNCDALSLPTSCSSPSGFCEISLKIFSMQGGDYTLNNLEVVYGKQVPITTGGLIPCGREWNDPATSWNDTEPCGLCYLIPLTDNIIKFLIKIVSVLAVLFIVIGGILYASSGSNSNSITMAKSAITKSVLGFAIVLIAWVMINVIMILFGFSDPLGDGSWKIFDCTT